MKKILSIILLISCLLTPSNQLTALSKRKGVLIGGFIAAVSIIGEWKTSLAQHKAKDQIKTLEGKIGALTTLEEQVLQEQRDVEFWNGLAKYVLGGIAFGGVALGMVSVVRKK